MAFCDAGQHATLLSYEYDDRRWCPEHRPPTIPADKPKPGMCELGRTHHADAVFWLPVLGKPACRKHLAILVREVIRRSEYGKR